MLTNPVYAGAYAFGRRTVRDDRKQIQAPHPEHAPQPAKLEVLIRDHHEGYISWTEFEKNQR